LTLLQSGAETLGQLAVRVIYLEIISGGDGDAVGKNHQIHPGRVTRVAAVRSSPAAGGADIDTPPPVTTARGRMPV
jgi:hypothetical protein